MTAPTATQSQSERDIVKVTLDEHTVKRRSPEVEHERAVAIYDLLEANRFRLAEVEPQPLHLHLSIEDNRLLFDIRTPKDEPIRELRLPLSGLRRVVKDYFMICDSYFNAIKTATAAQIEAIDMGRRGVHNEGAEIVRERLEGDIEVDTDTARRLFTLICVLHIRG